VGITVKMFCISQCQTIFNAFVFSVQLMATPVLPMHSGISFQSWWGV